MTTATAYKAGTMLMLQATIDRIGCAAAMPKDHKNEWLQNRFSLYPAGRIKKTSGKGTNLVWREADVEKARRLWDGRNESQKPSPGKFWKSGSSSPVKLPTPESAMDTISNLLDVAEQLLHQASALISANKSAA